MNLLTRDELRVLLEENNGPLVSIFMPVHPKGLDIRQDLLRLKNLISMAEERLVAQGLRTPEVNRLLAPIQALLDDTPFWQHQSEGLAILLSARLFRTYYLPLKLEELVVVADRFHLKPLLPLLNGEGRFYLLALSQNQVRLWLGTRDSLSEIQLEHIPKSLSEAVPYEVSEKQLQFHTLDSPGTPGNQPAVFHGHESGSDQQKNLLRFCRQVDRGLQQLLEDEQAPLVLASVDYLQPIYKQANCYPHLTAEGVIGNPETIKPEELYRRAWSIAQPHFRQAEQAAIVRYEGLAHTQQTSKDVRTIVPAAYYGRVETLFVALGRQRWGKFEAETNTLTLHKAAQPGDEDLLNAAAIQTFLNGGTVYVLEPGKMPGAALLAAVFRYSS